VILDGPRIVRRGHRGEFIGLYVDDFHGFSVQSMERELQCDDRLTIASQDVVDLPC
jgi:hypothetical protein